MKDDTITVPLGEIAPIVREMLRTFIAVDGVAIVRLSEPTLATNGKLLGVFDEKELTEFGHEVGKLVAQRLVLLSRERGGGQ